MAALLLSQTISEKYKEISEDINAVELNKKDIRRKTMKQLMEESFFHGAGWIGYNFIA
ncbi:MAG: hypothetical protein WCY19_05245 [Candidatus Gastranaerophilaceae bacterium]